ncbi:MAG: hypothetical protein ACTSW1_11680 [Candidatus Hodarchaeales archaeon]
MEPVTKEKIYSLLREMNYVEPPEAELAIRITKMAYIPMMISLSCWFYLYFGFLRERSYFSIVLMLGSIFFGLTLMLLSFGTYLYFYFSESKSPHWLYKGVFRTINSFFYWGSYLLLFVFTTSFHSTYDLEFVLIFLLISSPVIVMYNLTRNSRIRNWLTKIIKKTKEE